MVRVAASGDDDAGNRKIISALDALERMGVVAPGEKEREAKAAAEKAQMKAKSDQAKADFKAATAAKMAAEAGATAPPTAAPPPAAAAVSSAAPAAAPTTQESALDRMLGIQEDAPPARKEEPKDTEAPKVTVSDDVIKELMDVERKRGNYTKESESRMKEAFSSVNKLANQQDELNDEETARLQDEFEKLAEMLAPEAIISKEDIDIMKNKVFGFNTFWVTGNEPYVSRGEMEGGWVFRGNLRAERAEVYANVEATMIAEFGDKYELMMVEEEASMNDDGEVREPRVSFVMVPTVLTAPQPTTGWQLAVSTGLALATAVCCVQLGLTAEVSRLPPDFVAWMAQPENVEGYQGGAVLPPGLEGFDAGAYFEAAKPITLAVLGSAAAHEIGHVVAGVLRGVALSPPFFIPNGQLGTFGAITQIRSRPKNRAHLFDVAAAGPAAGGLVALLLFTQGLALSTSGVNPDLVPVPAALLQGSLLLGGVTQAVLGVDGTTGAQVAVHPALIAGWVALTTTALNLLPVGRLDGGRMVQAAYGRRTLSLSGILSYFGLGLGLLGGNLSLPFGLYLLVTQRSPERSPRDDVSGVSDARAWATIAAVAFAFLVLLPLGIEPPVDVNDFNNMPPL